MNFKRKRVKQRRSGCMLCKPNKNSHNKTAARMKARRLWIWRENYSLLSYSLVVHYLHCKQKRSVMQEQSFGGMKSHPCAFCVVKFISPCHLCPEWPEEFLDEEILTAEFMAERSRFLERSNLSIPFAH